MRVRVRRRLIFPESGGGLDDALRALAAEDREVLLLRYFEDCDYAEIARRLSSTEPAVRQRVSRALKKTGQWLRRAGFAGRAPVLLLLAAVHQQTKAAPPGLAASALAAGPAPLSPVALSLLMKITFSKALSAAALAAVLLCAAWPQGDVTKRPAASGPDPRGPIPARAAGEHGERGRAVPGATENSGDSLFAKGRKVFPEDFMTDEILRVWLRAGGDPSDERMIREAFEVLGKKDKPIVRYSISPPERESLLTGDAASLLLAAYASGGGARSEVDLTLLDAARGRFPDDPLVLSAWLMKGKRYLTEPEALAAFRQLSPGGAVPDLMEAARQFGGDNAPEALRLLKAAVEKPLNEPAAAVRLAEIDFLTRVKGLSLRQALQTETRVDRLETGNLFHYLEGVLADGAAGQRAENPEEGTPELALYAMALQELRTQSDSLHEQYQAASKQFFFQKELDGETGRRLFPDWESSRREIREQGLYLKGLSEQFKDFIDTAPEEELAFFWQKRQGLSEREAYEAVTAKQAGPLK